MGKGKLDTIKQIRAIHIIFGLLTLLLIAFAFRWQILSSGKYKQAASGRMSSSELTSLRGSIYSKDGTTLAYSEPRFDVYVWMDDLQYFEERGSQTRKEFVDKVSSVLEMSNSELEDLMNDSYSKGIRWIRIAKSIKADKWEGLRNLKTDINTSRALRGISFQYTASRVYPENRAASHVIGLTNMYRDELVGLGGIEGAFNGELNARRGFEVKETDAIGQAIARSLYLTVEPHPGSSVYLTIDTKLQKMVEERAKESVSQFKAKSATIIVMDPKTGDIMAMANYPDYDPNLREEEDPSVYTNKAVSVPYEIGSIGKIFTLAATLDLGLITPDTILQPEGHQGCEKISKDLLPLCTWDSKGQPPLKAWECLVKSDNLCFYHMALTFGHMIGSEGYVDIDPNDYQKFHEYLQKFGIGSPTGIALTGEDQGYMKNYNAWNLGDVAAFSYGHGYTATPIQALAGVSSVANNGIRMRPKIVDKIVKGDGKVVTFEPESFYGAERIISQETADLMNEIMYLSYLDAFRDNEYWYSDLKNYKIGMKSGTALIANEFGYTSDVHATQVGYDLSPERSFSMLVKLESPGTDQLSFYTSRVMWFDTFKYIKDYMQVPRIGTF